MGTNKVLRVGIGMSCTIIHHGHTRLISKVADMYPGSKVVILLTTDEEIIKHKGYVPELGYSDRREVLLSIKGVDEVVESSWSIDDNLMDKHDIDVFVNGPDNEDPVTMIPVLKMPRTRSVSSTDIRNVSMEARIEKMNSECTYYTPGPGNLFPAVLNEIQPIFSRGDDKYKKIMSEFKKQMTDITGLPNTVALQGSASLALEMSIINFINKNDKVLLLNTGYYSDRLSFMLKQRGYHNVTTTLDLVELTETGQLVTSDFNEYDWIVGCYVETSRAWKLGSELVQALAETSARVLIDATASVGLEGDHQFADVIAFSSVKGLFGLTGACFIQYNDNVNYHKKVNSFYMNIETHIEGKVTSPIHTIQSMLPAISCMNHIKKYLTTWRNKFINNHVCVHTSLDNQPVICTLVRVVGELPKGVHYSPRVILGENHAIINHLHAVCKVVHHGEDNES